MLQVGRAAQFKDCGMRYRFDGMDSEAGQT